MKSTPPKFFTALDFRPVDPFGHTINNFMNNSEEKGRKFGRSLAAFFLAAPKYIIAFFLPFIVLLVCLIIFDTLDSKGTNSAIIISALILALAYYFKK